jgi:hypothetical protein
MQIDHKTVFLVPVLVAALFAGVSAAADEPETEPGGTRGVLVEEIRNDQAAFYVRVDVDRPHRVYRGGDTMTATVKSDREGYLYLLYFMADDTIACLFPNQFQADNKIPASEVVVVPKPDANFRLRIGPPFGQETLKAIVSLQPLTNLQLQELIEKPITGVSSRSVRGAYVEELKTNPKLWAEHQVRITTVEPDPNVPLDKVLREIRGNGRKVGVFAGTRRFQDKRIRPLFATDRDAIAMEAALREHVPLNETFLLLNEQVTSDALRELICETLPNKTQPGDTVIIYISTHGTRCPDDDGDEVDGHDEVLVTYDTNLDSDRIRETALVDDVFGRWLQRLDGRCILVVLDACHSGGAAKQPGQRGVREVPEAVAFGKGFTLPGVRDEGQSGFLDSELPQVRDIGQRGTAVLAASGSVQLAFERRDRSLSVMTHFLLDYLRTNESATLPDVFGYLKKQVPAFVATQFNGREQTPVLFGEPLDDLFLRSPAPLISCPGGWTAAGVVSQP